MNIQELIDKSLEPLKDMENGYYKVLVQSNSRDRSHRWRRYIIIYCNNCNNVCAKKITSVTTRYDYVDYCSYRCYQSKHMTRELYYEGKLYTINDIPKKYRNKGLNPIQKWIDENKLKKEYMQKYTKRPCVQAKLKAKRKKEYAEIKSDPVKYSEYNNKKRAWALKNPDKVKVSSDKSRAKPEYKEKQKIYKAKRYRENQIEWRIRSFLRNIHLNSSVSKRNTWIKYGIDIHKIKDHLIKEAEQYGGYDNIRGKYHIDHIIPISLYDINNIEDIKKCNHPLNLRWLPAHENISRGNKIRPQDLEIIKTLPRSIYPKGISLKQL